MKYQAGWLEPSQCSSRLRRHVHLASMAVKMLQALLGAATTVGRDAVTLSIMLRLY